MQVDRRDFLKSVAPLTFSLAQPASAKEISQIDLNYSEPAPKELMQRYIELFSLIEKRNEGVESYMYATENSTLLAMLSKLPTRNSIINVTNGNTLYYAAKLESDPYFGDGFQFSTQESNAPYKHMWILTPDFAVNRFGRAGQDLSYNSLPYIDLLRKLHVKNVIFPDLYAQSKEFKVQFKSFVNTLERYA